MKKFLVVLVALLTVSLFAVPVTLSPYVANGDVTGKVSLSQSGFDTSFDINYHWNYGIGFGESADVAGINLSVDLLNSTISVSKLWAENDNLAFTWYKSQAFIGKYSLGWFNYLPAGAGEWGPLATFNLKDLGLTVATLDSTTVAANLVIDPVTVAAFADFSGYSFVDAGLEVSGEVVGLAFVAGFMTPSDYVLDLAYSATLGPVTLDPYFYIDNDGWYAGSNFAISPFSLLTLTGNVEYDGAISAWAKAVLADSLGTLTAKWTYPAVVQFHVAPMALEVGPVSVAAEFGSGDYDNWYDPWGNLVLDGDMVADPTNVSGNVVVTVSPELGLGFIADPTIKLFGGYKVPGNAFEANLKVTSAIYDLVNVKFALDFFDLTAWTLDFYYTVNF